ncbi:MAG: hypothetical protein KGI84_08855 [Elusimicrobia bacterium]|nr:hypothetical protein [Elusimicrobiota bacterium]
MIKKCLILALACVFIAGAQSFASDKNQVDFDQGTGVSAVVNSFAKEAGRKKLSSGVVKTYEVSIQAGAHGMGFLNKPLPKSDWESASVSAQRMSLPVPNVFDLRPELTPIENQGQCGSCWAFSLTATNRDGHAIMDGNDPGDLSQEWLVDNSPEAGGCNGGDFDSANDFITPGQPLAGSDPQGRCEYQEGSGQCPAKPQGPVTRIKAWHMLGKPGHSPSERDIESYMVSSGKPVSIAVAAGTGDWENYNKGVYNGCTPKMDKNPQLDHMINIVGWDNEGAKFGKNGNLPPGKGVWILRNSWGASWGDAGYMLSKMTDSQGLRCNGVAEQAAYFVFK